MSTTNNSSNMDVQGSVVTVVGSGSATVTFPASSTTLAGLSLAQSFTALQTFSGHIASGGTAPTIAAGAGAGTSPTVSITGTDTNGTISVTAGVTPSASGTVVTITFNSAWGTAPKTVILTPANSATALLSGATMVYAGGISTTVWTITSGTAALVATTVYQWYYQVLG